MGQCHSGTVSLPISLSLPHRYCVSLALVLIQFGLSFTAVAARFFDSELLGAPAALSSAPLFGQGSKEREAMSLLPLLVAVTLPMQKPIAAQES